MRFFVSAFVTLAFAVFTALVSAQDTNLAEVKRTFEDAGLVQDVPFNFTPSVLLGVTYFSAKTGLKPVRAGAHMSTRDTYSMPVFSIVGDPGLGPLVVAMIDPDAFSHQDTSIAQVRHFLGGNYAFNRASGLLTLPTYNVEISPYHYPMPYVSSGVHRYVFYLLRQSVEFSKQTLLNSTSPRGRFNLTDFALRTNLGDPIGGNVHVGGARLLEQRGVGGRVPSVVRNIRTSDSVFLRLVSGQDTNLTQVKQAFEEAGILKDVPIPFNPSVLFQVTYFSPRASPKTLYAGMRMDPKDVYSVPVFSVIGDPGPGPLVVVLVDPDALSHQNPIIAQVRHFLGGGYSFNPESGLLLVDGPVAPATPYNHPAPLIGSGDHRYIFYLFKHSLQFSTQTLVTSSSERGHFNLTDFALKTNLGAPIGGTFMVMGPDE
ncbi:hypothetical protein NLJ89_g7425 [Agrocybe chaxingu]|uniref:PEBP-like protein n=1 Tax=Agrocybe chaxingu TaxID=84603 RepID=A0A9W8JX84_9AGAR|nr:hypothetical protein NLJ89_g7425 [Agrocybe chaxingu]